MISNILKATQIIHMLISNPELRKNYSEKSFSRIQLNKSNMIVEKPVSKQMDNKIRKDVKKKL